jgi:hypothetical protein
MVWNKIISWFKDLTERNRTINEFNLSARNAFINNIVPTLLVASTSRGESTYKHEYSSIFFSGFRIKANAGRSLTDNEMLEIGKCILLNQSLARKLYVLGWDTLEIEDLVGKRGVKWEIKKFVSIGFMLR